MMIGAAGAAVRLLHQAVQCEPAAAAAAVHCPATSGQYPTPHTGHWGPYLAPTDSPGAAVLYDVTIFS